MSTSRSRLRILITPLIMFITLVTLTGLICECDPPRPTPPPPKKGVGTWAATPSGPTDTVGPTATVEPTPFIYYYQGPATLIWFGVPKDCKVQGKALLTIYSDLNHAIFSATSRAPGEDCQELVAEAEVDVDGNFDLTSHSLTWWTCHIGDATGSGSFSDTQASGDIICNDNYKGAKYAEVIFTLPRITGK